MGVGVGWGGGLTRKIQRRIQLKTLRPDTLQVGEYNAKKKKIVGKVLWR